MYTFTIRHCFILLTVALVWGACTKAKPDFPTSGNLPADRPISNSSVRLVNISGLPDLEVNGQYLTNHLVPKLGETLLPSGTFFFPGSGKMGQTYYIPQEFISARHTAQVMMVNLPDPNGKTKSDSVKFQVTDNYSQPNDYYLVHFRTEANSIGYTDSIFPIPRAVSPASDPTHIRIRLLNLSSAPDDANLVGRMSLTYADGTHVSTVTDTVSPGGPSQYAELPYGSYQFKIFTEGGLAVPSAQQDVPPLTIDQFTAETVVEQVSGSVNTHIVYTPMVSYPPGGVYTLVISDNYAFRYLFPGGDIVTYENSFSVVTDIAPTAGVTYARLQAVNTVPGSTLAVSVDGQALGKTLDYDSAGSYGIYVNGTHQVQVTDKNGAVVVQKTITLNGNDNITAWVYPSSGGSDSILFAQNNLSGNWYGSSVTGDGSDGSSSIGHTYSPFWIRFLNLCPDLPLVTFTQGNGQLFTDGNFSSALAAQNLSPGGLPDTYFQYISALGGAIQAYQSQPLILPGDWLSGAPSLTGADFVKSLAATYPHGKPASEPGVYTVALTGRWGPDAPAGQSAHMIVVKHNQ